MQTDPAWGDLGNGLYANPVLYADFSDPDICRVGSDFYLVASDFHYIGMQILHSRDLVNWTVIGQVFDRLDIAPGYDCMERYGEGTWAPSIRYHDGRYYVYVCTPREGLFMWHATQPAGPWSDTVTVQAVENWEDPCPFWDDDGQAYLVRGVKGAGPIILHRMAPDGTRLLDEGREIYRGHVAEGPKLYKRGSVYYILLPENGVFGGCQTVLRASRIYGPYERRVVLPDGSTHQGGIVDTGPDESWFMGFKYAGHLGRVCHLEPVHWGHDGWPVFGDKGVSVRTGPKPRVGPSDGRRVTPAVSDPFTADTLNPIWQWNHNPLPDKWSLTKRPGFLRLCAVAAPTLVEARNTLTQKLWGPNGTATVQLDTGGMQPGHKAGITFLWGRHFAWLAAEHTGEGVRLCWDNGAGPVLTQSNVWLRAEYRGAEARLAWSTDGHRYETVPAEWKLEFDCWKGARLGLFSFGPNPGHADFADFQYEPGGVMRPSAG